MSRLQQLNPNGYRTVAAIDAEIANIVRYINSAEVGNLSLRELMETIFDEDGNVALGFSLRFTPGVGVEYGVTTAKGETAWALLVSHENIRGEPGADVGTISAPVMANRVNVTATAGQTTIPYDFAEGSITAMVFVNGVLKSQTEYASDIANNEIVMAQPLALNDKVTIFSVRNTPGGSYARADFTAGSGQTSFPYQSNDDDVVIVYKAGLLVYEGSDYTRTPTAINFSAPMTSGTRVTIVTIDNPSILRVAGIMSESVYTQNGAIRFDKIAIPDGAIAQAKISGLITELFQRRKTHIGTTPPGSTGDLWIDTSGSAPVYRAFINNSWVSLAGMSLPGVSPGNALRYLRVNAQGDGYELAQIDTSGFIPSGQKGAANGVATLAASGRLAFNQWPEQISNEITALNGALQGSIANGTYPVGFLPRGAHTLRKLIVKLASGSCNVEVFVNGISRGSGSVGTSASSITLSGNVNVAVGVGADVSIQVSSGSSPNGLSYMLTTDLTSGQ